MKSITASESAYIERFGRFWEASGSSRTAGRIIAWLMICDPPHQSAADLVGALGVSSGSVSTLTRQLIDLRMIERVTFPGDRASYYQLRDHVWLSVVESQLDSFRELAALAAEGRELRVGERADRVEDLAEVMAFFMAEWPALLERLRTRTSSRGPDHAAAAEPDRAGGRAPDTVTA